MNKEGDHSCKTDEVVTGRLREWNLEKETCHLLLALPGKHALSLAVQLTPLQDL